MSLADIVPVALEFDFRPRPSDPAWKRWRRKPGVQKRLTAYKRAWRAERRQRLGRTT